MKILQVVTDRDRRGAQLYAVDLEGGLQRLGGSVRTVALAPGSSANPIEIEALGERRLSIQSLRSLRELAKQHDVVIAHGSSTLVACAAGLIGCGTPFIYRQISDPLFWAPSGLRRFRVGLYLRRAAHVVSLADSAASTVAVHFHLDQSRISVIPNAVVADRFQPVAEADRRAARRQLGIHEDSFCIAYVGALVPEKGVDLVIEAVKRTEESSLVVLGAGPEEAGLRRQAGEAEASDIRFFSPTIPADLIYQASDVLVLASKGGDSMPAVLIEAGLCGLPTVTTPIGAITDVVVDGQTGFVVEVGSVEQLADRLRRLRDEPQLRRSLGSRARDRCLEHFSIAPNALMWLDVARRVLQSED